MSENKQQNDETMENQIPESQAAQTQAKAPKEKKVKIRLPRLRKDQGDEIVGVNGKLYQIKVGVTVEVPESVAEVLQHHAEVVGDEAQVAPQLQPTAVGRILRVADGARPLPPVGDENGFHFLPKSLEFGLRLQAVD